MTLTERREKYATAKMEKYVVRIVANSGILDPVISAQFRLELSVAYIEGFYDGILFDIGEDDGT
jgi:hypothetical protein